MDFNWSVLKPDEAKYYVDLCPVNEYYILTGVESLPGISPGLVKKSDTFFLACSGDGKDQVYYMANMQRKDLKDQAIDQMPFGFLINSSITGSMSAALIQHGNWEGRTVHPPISAWDEILSGNYTQYQNLQILPLNQTGSIYDIRDTSQEKAFTTLISGLNEEIYKAS